MSSQTKTYKVLVLDGGNTRRPIVYKPDVEMDLDHAKAAATCLRKRRGENPRTLDTRVRVVSEYEFRAKWAHRVRA